MNTEVRIDQAPQKLKDVSVSTLMTAYAALTHRIHAASLDSRIVTADSREGDLRAQRDLIHDEILIRTDPTWGITTISHQDCTECRSLASTAVANARIGGSSRAVYQDGEHLVTVVRLLGSVTEA